MMDWIVGSRLRLPVLLGIYFALHVVIRISVSSSLDFDESEQVFLSQHLLMGYNSQPPLYTWLQRGLFEIFGYSIFALALLKNLFIWSTYLLVFESVRKATDNLRLAAVATLGMFTIPQIAWESHRDLSHTVGAMFATALLVYGMISLSKADRRGTQTLWYALIGIAVGVGAMFKYNFAIVVFAFAFAAASIPRYRPLLLDRRMFGSIAIAALIVVPHAWWMLQHPGLASGKTIATLTSGQSDYWAENVIRGLLAISLALITCCAGPLATFWFWFGRRGPCEQPADSVVWQPARQLLERFLLAVLAVLLAIVLSGHAVEFENRWFQPFIFLVPAFLTLAFAPAVLAQRRSLNLSSSLTVAVMGVILLAVLARPVGARIRGDYSRLNMPYAEASARMLRQCESPPELIVVRNMRVAGNLKMQYPEALVISRDAPHLAGDILSQHPEPLDHVLVVCDKASEAEFGGLASFSEKILQVHLLDRQRNQVIDVDYLYGSPGDQKRFLFGDYRIHPMLGVAAKVASAPRSSQSE